ncbi:hypothetical protein NliqN6_4880 [Naganishia liquefaciens]|uniref:Mediator of RNA polymerase II transcription subunit 5 n=1 Tax=Naganishia liquefaciens TaxID=104408 RepID=A0A8H3YGN4_9TREE|nr:hypothetical protein NliqN6_4880 [Naganishia liquefaciens]
MASVPAQRFSELARRLLAREKASGSQADPALEFADCLLDAFQKVPTAKPLIISYLRECILENLLSPRRVVRSLLTRRKMSSHNMDEDATPSLSGDDLEALCNTFSTGLPITLTSDLPWKECTDAPSTNSIAELIDHLDLLLPDVTEDRPALSQVFTSLLSTMPSVDQLSKDDRAGLASLRLKSLNVASFSKTALQELNLLAEFSGTEAPPVDGPPQLYITVQTEGEQSDLNPPTSPEPWSAEQRRSASKALPKNTSRIQAPPYITFMIQDAMESARIANQRDRSTIEDSSTGIPPSYKRIIHTAPEISSRPLNFVYHLLSASFGLLVASIDDLQERAILEERQSTSMMDTEDEVLLNLDGGTSGDMSDNLKFAKVKELIARDGWKEWLWCFNGLLEVLHYWKLLVENSAKGVFVNSWQFPPSEQLREVIQKFRVVNEQELERCDQVVRQLRQGGSVGGSSRPFATIQLFEEIAEERQLLIRSHGSSTQTETDPTKMLNLDTNLLNVGMSQFSGRFFETLMCPGSWKGLAEHLEALLDKDTSLSDNSLTILTDCYGLLDLTCQFISPVLLLNKVIRSVDALDQESRSSNGYRSSDDPQTVFSTFGAWYLLAHAICVRFRLTKPELLRSCSTILNIKDIATEDNHVLRGWIEALFGSTGIGDDLLQMTSPIKLLSLSTTVVSQAILAATAQVIDLETLRGGLSYFSQPLLSWCQIGIIHWLCQEIQRQGMYAHVYLDVLQVLLEAGDFPSSILKATGKDILNLFEHGNGLELVLESSNIDVLGIQKKARSGIHRRSENGSSFATQTVSLACGSVLRYLLQSPHIKAHDIKSAVALYLLRISEAKCTHRANHKRSVSSYTTI